MNQDLYFQTGILKYIKTSRAAGKRRQKNVYKEIFTFNGIGGFGHI